MLILVYLEVTQVYYEMKYKIYYQHYFSTMCTTSNMEISNTPPQLIHSLKICRGTPLGTRGLTHTHTHG